jgi:branched-subunit amino acid aminotransferase/4-amino-4-deoxychorismate lyase
MDHEPLAYFNGRLIPLSQAAVSVFDGGFMQGVTVAEQLRTFGGKLFRIELHLSRLARSLQIVGVDPGVSLEKLGSIATELAERNAKLIEPADDQGVTIFVTPGSYAGYASLFADRGPTVCVHTQPLAFGTTYDKYQKGDALVVTDVRHVPAACWPAELKCRSRMHYYLADRKARAIEAGARALLLDERGHVTEASTANIVIYRRDKGLISPPKERILPGVSLAVLEELATRLGVGFSHDELVLDDAASADEVLLCSTSPCVWPVTRLNGRPIGNGQPGPLSKRLLNAWSQMVGLDIEAQARRFAMRPVFAATPTKHD